MLTKIEDQIKDVFINNSIELKNQIQNYYDQNKRKPKSQDFEKIIADFLTNSKKFTNIKLEKGNNPNHDILINNFYKIDCKTSYSNTDIKIGNYINIRKTLLIATFINDKINFYLLNLQNQQKYLSSFKLIKGSTNLRFSLSKLIKHGFKSILELTILKPKSFYTFDEFLKLNLKYQFIQTEIKSLTSISKIEIELKKFIQNNQKILIDYLNQYQNYHQKNCNSFEFEQVIFDFLNQNHNLINHIFKCNGSNKFYDFGINFFNSKINQFQTYYLDIKTTNKIWRIAYNNTTFFNSKNLIKNSHIFTKSKMKQFLKHNPKSLLIFCYEKNTNNGLFFLNAKTQLKYYQIFFQAKNTFQIQFSLVFKKYKNTNFLKSITIFKNVFNY
ncbi:hypothetical protein ATP_00419 [Candidatus Phytoplasma mali]|uniref:Uncharacterized protein n=1 Tax=Phytoplasma mali (strain AT) TaxID=482235 RepID=B3QZJ9_PHYMT|nr:hypothetical protein [Candidatus Phytoplasma mali]CAP18606.1 hypothetical protein ATP_00419 [Candidatus Phytoplasma mali]